MSDRAYSAKTVITAQRRVLKLAVNVIGRMSGKELLMLRTDGPGLMTLNELTEHMVAALHLKIKQP